MQNIVPCDVITSFIFGLMVYVDIFIIAKSEMHNLITTYLFIAKF
jgi:hypothetical protein